jgi:ubiquinol-cytochrome c reductase iron-sulfur subunit
MRLHPSAFANDSLGEKAKSWGYEGIVAYSKICTHVGCPVGLYEQQTHHLLCPCHQSTFDVTRDCNVIFGPAKRALPQLKITVDDEGYLVAPQGFVEPVGPSYWERKK